MSDQEKQTSDERATGGDRKKNKWPGRIGLALGIALIAYFAYSLVGGTLLPDGTPAPAWKLPMADGSGGSMEMKDLEGRVVVLDFWSTTCPPCMKQMKDLEVIHRRMKERGVEVVGVACGGESVERIEKFKKQKNVGYPMVVDEGEATLAYRVLSLPTIYVIGKDGKVAASHRGYWDATSLAKAINRALD